SPEGNSRHRPVISARERGPGPGRYALPPTVGYVNHDVTKPNSPAYSLGSRMSSALISVDSSPGPRYRYDARMTRFGRMESPSYSILGRGRPTRAAETFRDTPGPGAYSPEKAPPVNAHRRAPSYTMGGRTRYRGVDAAPAPNSYTLPFLMGCRVPHKPSGASYSLSSRRQVGGPTEDLSKSPGPARYSSTDPDVYQRRQPSFSLQSRTKRPSYSWANPGPGAYSPERVKGHLPTQPSFTLGIRHSEFVTPLVVDVTD
uniref:Outer dense fiber of sperm tails 3-like 2a n=1 Tax=Tetraodon nigroviridis TaxID=99883 RepID=H3DIJ3_TETNG